jgi:hypothetical protein
MVDWAILIGNSWGRFGWLTYSTPGVSTHDWSYVKLEVHRIATKKNHFAQKAQLYHAASIAAYEKLKEVNATCPKLAIIL